MAASFDPGEIAGNLARASQAVEPKAAAALTLALEFVGAASDRIVPLDEGALMNSRTATIKAQGKVLRGVVSYNTPYAVRQHEDLSLSHPGGRQGKFLESAFNQNTDKVRRLVAAALAGAFS